jgi:DNA-binding response OmpR family regulator
MSGANHPSFRPSPPGFVQPALHILLVEGHDTIRQLTAQALVRLGYEVDAAIDGLSGWEALRSHCYDLLITNRSMPGLSGIELIQKLRSAKMTLPVILASEGLDLEEVDQCRWLQPVVSLPKPFTSDEMLETVAAILSGSSNVPFTGARCFPASGPTMRATESCRRWSITE